jgi:arsenical pump membrane protein
MTGTARNIATPTIFAAMLVLMVVRPRRWNEAWWTMLAAVAMLVLGLVTPREALGAVLAGKNTLLFLLSLLALSLLVGKSGFLIGLRSAARWLRMCVFVANVGSLLLPISNLTNLLFADAFHQTFAAFAARMIVPQLVALVTTYAILRWHFRRDLPRTFDGESLPEPASVVPNHPYFLVCVTVLVAVLICYFLAPLLGLEPYVFAFAAIAVLALAGMANGRVQIRFVRELVWDLFPFVIGLFIAVQGLENLGIVGVSSRWLAEMRPGSPQKLLAAAGATAFASNIVNNLPAALIARSILLRSHAHMGTVLSALIGTNVGSMITPFGSLATMLVLAYARRDGEEVRAGQLVRLGLWAVPVILVLTTLALALTFALVR